MTYGIRSFNSSGFTQIDETSEVFQVVQTGTKAANVAYVSLTNSTLPSDIFVFGRPSGGGTSGVKYFDGKVEDFTVSGTRYLRIYMTYNQACDYAICQRCSEFTEPNSGYGINVYKSNGDLGFTSEVAMFRGIATRSVTLTSSSGGFDSAWYQGAAGSIDEAYVLLGPYIQYEYEQYAELGEKFLKYTFRKAKFDYNNHTMGTTAASTYNDLPRNANVFTRTTTGQKTELMGYIV